MITYDYEYENGDPNTQEEERRRIKSSDRCKYCDGWRFFISKTVYDGRTGQLKKIICRHCGGTGIHPKDI